MSRQILQCLACVSAYDHIRIIDPLKVVKRQLKQENITVNMLPLSSLTAEIAHNYDMICLHGAFCAPLVPILKSVPFCLFLDDLMTDIPKGNPAALSPSRRMALEWGIEHARSLVCTTTHLAKAYGRADALIAPNLINLEVKENLSADVGYSFGNTHSQDLQLLNDLTTKRRVIFFGNTLPHKLSEFYQDEFGNVLLKPLYDNIGFVPMQTNYKKYQAYFNNLEFGVGLCPLLDNSFNHAKSIWKFLEYLNHGSVSVVSDVLPYSEIPNDCCVKVKDNAWGKAIEEAFEKRDAIYHAACCWVFDNFTYDKNPAWLNTYEKI